MIARVVGELIQLECDVDSVVELATWLSKCGCSTDHCIYQNQEYQERISMKESQDEEIAPYLPSCLDCLLTLLSAFFQPSPIRHHGSKLSSNYKGTYHLVPSTNG